MPVSSNKIEILNNQKKIKGIREISAIIKEAVNATLKFEGVKEKCLVSVCLTDNEEIAELNGQFRDKPQPTDVLSFPSGEYPSPVSPVFLGDIIISLERAAAQAEEYGNTLAEEVAFLTSHSVLHLLGYDHMEPDEEKEMYQKQDQVMDIMKVSRKTNME